MSPVIRQLKNSFLEFPPEEDNKSLTWTFSDRIKNLGPDFYSKIMTNHPLLNIEYGVLCQQLRTSLTSEDLVNKKIFIDRLVAALMLAELLEHLYLHYLNVPREVLRLRKHQILYKELLAEQGYLFSERIPELNAVDVGISMSQTVRETTLHKNWYRLLMVRIKRLLDLINAFGTNSEAFRVLVFHLDRLTDPILPYVAWCFLLPRLLTNLFLLLKHTIPGPWMSDEESAIGWSARIQSQLHRRWFELGNDSVWVGVGLVNCFVLTGALAPIGMYLNVIFFAYDIVLAALRAYIELNRLFELHQEYTVLIEQETDEGAREELIDFQNQLNLKINYEKIRFGLHVSTTIGIFVSMCFAIPVFALTPLIPLIGAVFLVAVSLVSFILSKYLEQYKPKDTVEKPSGVVQLGMFAQPKVYAEHSIPLEQIAAPIEP